MAKIISKIEELAAKKQKFLTSDGQISYSELYASIGLPFETIIELIKTDFKSISRYEINQIIRALECTYEDLFTYDNPHVHSSETKSYPLESDDIDSLLQLAISNDLKSREVAKSIVNGKTSQSCWILFKDKENNTKKIGGLFINFLGIHDNMIIKAEFEIAPNILSSGFIPSINEEQDSVSKLELLTIINENSTNLLESPTVAVVLPTAYPLFGIVEKMKIRSSHLDFPISICTLELRFKSSNTFS